MAFRRRFDSHSKTVLGEFGVLLRDCRVELFSLAVAVLITAVLANSLLAPVREWDSTAVVILIGALWMAVCTALYRLLPRTLR